LSANAWLQGTSNSRREPLDVNSSAIADIEGMILMAGKRLHSSLVPILLWSFCFAGCGGIPRQQNTAPQDGVDDRERVYARFGSPDQIEAHPNDQNLRPPEEGEGDSLPFEVWSYSHLDGVGENVKLEFVDACLCAYKLVPTPQTAKMMAALSDED
jgi:hypothetical protein